MAGEVVSTNLAPDGTKTGAKPRKLWVLVLKSAIRVYVILLLFMFFYQGRLIFFPQAELYSTPAENDWAFDEIVLPVGEHQVYGWFIKAVDETPRTVMFSHGNAGNIGTELETARIFREMGYNVAVYDYGGYGRSTGRPSERRCYEDARAVWDYLTRTRGIPGSSIVLAGRSLGGGVTAQLATEVEAGAVILESTFYSIARMAQQMYPVFPAFLLVRHKFASGEKVGAIDEPVLHIHSRDDEMIPFSHGQSLFEASTAPKEFLEIHGGHNDGIWASMDIYVKGISEFLAEHHRP